MNRLHLALLASAALLTGSQARAATDHQTIARHLEAAAAAYFDIVAQYPEEFTCSLRSPELVASLDPGSRQAWGDGYLVFVRGSEGVRLEPLGLADPRAQPLFELALAAWQLRLGSELKGLEAFLPTATVAVATAVLAAPLTHEPFDEPHGDGRRFGLRARKAQQPFQELVFDTGVGNQLLSATLSNRDGSQIALELENRREPWSDERWLVTSLDATFRKASGAVEVTRVDLSYQIVENSGAVTLKELHVRREDESGQLLRRNKRDVNPISFRFSDCRAPIKLGASPP